MDIPVQGLRQGIVTLSQLHIHVMPDSKVHRDFVMPSQYNLSQGALRSGAPSIFEVSGQ